MKPHEAAELGRIAADLDAYGMANTARRIRSLVSDPVDDERPCPVQDREAGHQVKAIPWGLAEILYPAYGHGQTLEELAKRGGFGRKELGLLAADCYSPRPRLREMPLLTLYEMARRSVSFQDTKRD